MPRQEGSGVTGYFVGASFAAVILDPSSFAISGIHTVPFGAAAPCVTCLAIRAHSGAGTVILNSCMMSCMGLSLQDEFENRADARHVWFTCCYWYMVCQFMPNMSMVLVFSCLMVSSEATTRCSTVPGRACSHGTCCCGTSNTIKGDVLKIHDAAMFLVCRRRCAGRQRGT